MITQDLLKEMAHDCQNIDNNYDFFDLVIAHTGSYVSRDKFLNWFDWLWKYIPYDHLYEPYKELLSDIHIIKGRSYYPVFFQPELLEKIVMFNKQDTVENPDLNALLDEDGFLTVHLGHSKKTMQNCNSWALRKDQAIDLGRIKTLFDDNSPRFYCVTGKVKLNDIITSINVRGRKEIIVLQKNVKSRTKEYYSSAKNELMQGWTCWV